MVNNFTFCTPTKVHFGKGVIKELHNEVTAVGTKVLLVYGGSSIKRSGLYDQFLSAAALSQIHASLRCVRALRSAKRKGLRLS